ncbi:MAG: hypothetical protein KDC71_12885 [Acidobacteria bacterium]|nr:hypothetical protein [Acidobacteriota bacterium]
MGFMAGSVACTRFNVVATPTEIDFDRYAFSPILKGTYTKESVGFIPFEPGEPYEVGQGRYAFRLRIDKIQIDSTQLKERLRELIKTETELSGPPGKKKMRDLKDLAEEELLMVATPRTKIIECYLDQYILFVATTSKGQLGTVCSYLKRLGVEVEYKTPWLDHQLEKDPPEWMELKDPAQSILGCEFIEGITHDEEIYLEGVKGSVKLATPEGAVVSLRGVVGQELERLLGAGAHVISAKLQIGETPLSFDGSSFRIGTMKLRGFKADHWTMRLESRMEQIQATFDFLEEKFQKKVTAPSPS